MERAGHLVSKSLKNEVRMVIDHRYSYSAPIYATFHVEGAREALSKVSEA
jgi:hypothetical protein